MNYPIYSMSLLALLATGCSYAQEQPEAKQTLPTQSAVTVPYSITTPTGQWKLVWHDEFDRNGLPDSTRWSYDTHGNSYGWGNNEAQHYTAGRLRNASVKDGILSITAHIEKTEGKGYTSARLVTKGHADWQYGRFEIRAKLPRGRGTWPAIWMLPTDNDFGSWPASGEIDIMENVGYDPNIIIGTVHTNDYNHRLNTQKSGRINVPDNADMFHTYALEWTEKECRIYVDSTLYFTYTNDGKDFRSWPFERRFHLILNLAIGGDWGGQKGIDNSRFPHVFQIDYVRVYQLKKEES